MSSESIPLDIPSVYKQILPDQPTGITFLFGSRFLQAVDSFAQEIAPKYSINVNTAIEELRRLLVIKTYTVDTLGTKIFPTPLSE